MVYRTGFSLHRAADGAFASWTTNGASLRDGVVALEPTAGRVVGEAGLECVAGEATSPETPTDFPFAAAVPSWNASLPAGTWLETLVRVRAGGSWTSWRSLGVWAPDDSTIRRHSVSGQDDGAARVATDTLEPSTPADAYQARVRLFAALGPDGAPRRAAMPELRALSIAYSDPRPSAVSSRVSAPGSRGLTIGGVPCCSQMRYPDGGRAWCSPTSVSMVLGYWRCDDGPCEKRVRDVVAGVYDRVYDGHGNWSFNVAYAGSLVGMEAYVARFSGLERLEPWIAAGVPIVLSLSWDNDGGRPLSAAPVPRSSGHLTTLVGFDREGDAVMNEPAAPSDDAVRRVYVRRELEARWLSASGGTAYVIFPSGTGENDRARLFASTIG